MVELFLAGECHKDIAARFGISRQTVTDILQRRGFTWERGLGPEQVEEATRLYVEEGWSLASVGELLGCHPGTVRKALLDTGVETRPRAW